MIDLVLVSPPAAEPIATSDMMLQLGMGTITDSALSAMIASQLSGYIAAARHYCETYTRSVYMTQTWLMKMDGFPRPDMHYAQGWERHAILLPKVPFQSLAFVNYVDTTGTVCVLPQDTDYGNDPTPAYAFQIDPGSDLQAARVAPSWLRPWPPTRMVQSNVTLQFKCGFGGPVNASMALDSAILTGPTFLNGDVGQAVQVPGAGANGAAMTASIASVDGNGQATLTSTASTAVTNATAWVGKQVPPPILQAIKFMAQFFYEQGSVVDVPVPRVIMALLDPYRNLVS